MQGNKTHQLKQRQIQDGETSQDWREGGQEQAPTGDRPELTHPEARQSETDISRGGMNQESRDHNKHNHQTQDGHKAQHHHSPAEEKH